MASEKVNGMALHEAEMRMIRWMCGVKVTDKLCNELRQRLGMNDITSMWANAQRDGRPAEHRWCPIFNAAKFGSRPLFDCRAVTLRVVVSVSTSRSRDGLETYQLLVSVSSRRKFSMSRSRLGLGH